MKSSQEYPVAAGVPQGSILHSALLLLCINDDVICNITIYADDTTTLYSKCDQLIDFYAGETQLSSNTGAIDVKMDRSVLD